MIGTEEGGAGLDQIGGDLILTKRVSMANTSLVMATDPKGPPKLYPLILSLLFCLSVGTAGCGAEIPRVEGTYRLTETECPGVFADEVVITQSGSGDVITFEPPGLSGSIDSTGDFNIANANTTCTGSISEGMLAATCITDDDAACDIVYERTSS